MKILRIAALMASAAVTSGAEEPAALPAAAGPPHELEELRGFVGAWRCEGTVSELPEAAANTKVVTRLEVKPTLGGFWLSGRAVPERGKGLRAVPDERIFFWSYDSVLRQYAGGWLDSRGGWSTQTSFGWHDGELTMFGHTTLNGSKASGREIFTKPANGSFTRRYELLQVDQWVRVGEETCRAAKR
jgi:hypothetical protein